MDGPICIPLFAVRNMKPNPCELTYCYDYDLHTYFIIENRVLHKYLNIATLLHESEISDSKNSEA